MANSFSRAIFTVVSLYFAAQVPAAASTLYANSTNFYDILSSATSGDTIVMQGHFADKLYVKNKSYNIAVTIDASDASIHNAMQMSYVNGMNIVGGTWRFDPANMDTLNINNSKNISVAHASFVGDVLAASGRAIMATYSSNITIRDNDFMKVRTSILINASTDMLVTRNRIKEASTDGIDVSNSHRVIISCNHCSGTVITPGAHPDCIQLWSVSGQPVQSNIIILNNIAEGDTQGFTSFDPGDFSGTKMVFAGNLGKLTYPQGIACYGCQDSLFLDNTLITMPGATYRSIIRVPDGINNTFENNQLFDFRAKTMEDVMAVTHVFSTFRPEFRTGSEFDLSPAVPEPEIWLQLIAGFALIGIAARQRSNMFRRSITGSNIT